MGPSLIELGLSEFNIDGLCPGRRRGGEERGPSPCESEYTHCSTPLVCVELNVNVRSLRGFGLATSIMQTRAILPSVSPGPA
jgi:hypothetical protein